MTKLKFIVNITLDLFNILYLSSKLLNHVLILAVEYLLYAVFLLYAPRVITTRVKSGQKVNVYLPSLMMKVPNHLYVLI
jgi:hypothetical protein